MSSELSLYQRVLGVEFALLPIPIQEIHSVTDRIELVGTCEVTRGCNPVANIISKLVGFPNEGMNQPIRVVIGVENNIETWSRVIGASNFSSKLFDKKINHESYLVERFGPLLFYFSLPVDKNGLSMNLKRMTIFGLRFPKILYPNIHAKESLLDNKFCFDVRVDLPIFGLLIHYQGQLERKNERKNE